MTSSRSRSFFAVLLFVAAASVATIFGPASAVAMSGAASWTGATYNYDAYPAARADACQTVSFAAMGRAPRSTQGTSGVIRALSPARVGVATEAGSTEREPACPLCQLRCRR